MFRGFSYFEESIGDGINQNVVLEKVYRLNIMNRVLNFLDTVKYIPNPNSWISFRRHQSNLVQYKA